MPFWRESPQEDADDDDDDDDDDDNDDNRDRYGINCWSKSSTFQGIKHTQPPDTAKTIKQTDRKFTCLYIAIPHFFQSSVGVEPQTSSSITIMLNLISYNTTIWYYLMSVSARWMKIFNLCSADEEWALVRRELQPARFPHGVLACMCCGSSLKIPCAFSHAHETLVNIFTDQFKLRWDDYKSIKSLRLHHWPVQALTGDAKARGLVMVDSPDCVHVQQGSDHYNLRRDFS